MLWRLLQKDILILNFCLLGATNVLAAHIPGQSQLAGWVYIDRNNDGILAFSNQPNPEYVIDDVLISLYSSVGNVESLVATMLTDDFGRYLFENINPGTYAVRQTPPVEFVDGIDTLGVLYSLTGQPIPGNASAGAMTNNAFINIVLTSDVAGEYYNFGERGLAPGFVSKRYLLASTPELTTPFPPPPPPDPQGEPDPLSPEPTSRVIALIAGCGGWLAAYRSRRRTDRFKISAPGES